MIYELFQLLYLAVFPILIFRGTVLVATWAIHPKPWAAIGGLLMLTLGLDGAAMVWQRLYLYPNLWFLPAFYVFFLLLIFVGVRAALRRLKIASVQSS